MNNILHAVELEVINITTKVEKLDNLKFAHKSKSFLSIGSGAILGLVGGAFVVNSGMTDIGELLMTIPLGALGLGFGGFLINNGINEATKSNNCKAEKQGLLRKIEVLRDNISSPSVKNDPNALKT